MLTTFRASLALALLLAAASPLLAQGTAEEKLQQDPAVSNSQLPEPTAQGTRAPDSSLTDTQSVPLAQAVMEIWRSPVDLQGRPIAEPRLSAPPVAAAPR
jgi:hypothetical protein